MAETASAKRRHICRKTHAEQIDEIDLSRPVPHAHDIDGSALPYLERFDREVDAAIAEVAQERIASTERQKTERRRLFPNGLWEETVNNLVRRAVSAEGNEVARTAGVGIPCDLGSLSWRSSRGDFHFEPGIAEALECRTEQFSGASAARGGIHDG